MNLSKHIRFFLAAFFVSIAFLCFVPAVQATTAPTIGPPGAVVSGHFVPVSMTADTGAQIYYTLDGSTPTSSSTLYVSSFSVLSSTVVKAIAILSGVSSSVTVSYICVDYDANAVISTGPQMWLRSDFGIVSSAGAVSQWTDISGSNCVAIQSTPANQPTLITNAINNLPAVNFNGSSQYLQLPVQVFRFIGGFTIFVVTKPASSTASGQIMSIGQGTISSSFGFGQNSGNTYFYVYSGTSPSSVSNTTAVSQQYQLVEALYNDVNTGTLFNNGNQTAQSTSLFGEPTINTANNYIGQSTAGGSFYSGQIAELIAYAGPLTTIQRAQIEGYLLRKYQFILQSPTPPNISVPTSTLGGPSQIAIAAQNGVSIYYTTDGTTPTATSTLYTGPVNIYYSQTLKAIAINSAGNSSTVSSATYTLNSTQWPAPNSSDMTPLQIQLQIPTTSVSQ
jgi:hypothetical protein